MGRHGEVETSIQKCSSSKRSLPTPPPSSDRLIGDGFTAEEVHDALKPTVVASWHPPMDYVDTEIKDLVTGPQAVALMGRVANIFDVANSPKTPRSARGCLKLCVRDARAAICVRLWYAVHTPKIRLGALVSIWTTHISNAEQNILSATSVPLFASLFPERDRSCHIMIHENNDDGNMFNVPLGYQIGLPVDGVMTLQSFVNGGCDVVGAKVLVVMKGIGAKKQFIRKDNTIVARTNLQVHDNTAHATLGLWGLAASSPFGTGETIDTSNSEATGAGQSWTAGETVLLLQSPTCKIGHNAYLSLSSSTLVDVDPAIPDAFWLRRWSLRKKHREALNPPFPNNLFDLSALQAGSLRCLFTLAELDELARAAPQETFHGYLSLVIMEINLVGCWRRHMLLCGECCSIPTYANDLVEVCTSCDELVELRLNPQIIGQLIDESASIAPGKLLMSPKAWRDLLGRTPQDLLKLSLEDIQNIADRLLFCRLTVSFGWAANANANETGGRLCILGVES